MIRFGVFFPSQLTTRQAIRDLRMPEEEFDEIATQANNDTKQVEEGFKVWKTMTGDVIARRVQPTRDFREAFEASVRGEWEAVKKELEKSLHGASSQDGLVSTQITNPL